MQGQRDAEPPEDNDLFKEANMALHDPDIMIDDDDDGGQDVEFEIFNIQLNLINHQLELFMANEGVSNYDDEETTFDGSSEEGDICPALFPPGFMDLEHQRSRLGCGSDSCPMCSNQ